jgi:hypothetical protein
MGITTSFVREKSENIENIFESLKRITTSVETLKTCSHYNTIFRTFLDKGSWIEDVVASMRKSHPYEISPALEELFSDDKSIPFPKNNLLIDLQTMMSNLPEEGLQLLLIFAGYPIFLRSSALNHWLMDSSKTDNTEKGVVTIALEQEVHEDDEDDDDDEEEEGIDNDGDNEQ